MTVKEFTAEEIMSSLEVIATTRNCNECKIRNCKCGTCNCSQTTVNAALLLINRQKAEIERLNSVNDEKFRQWDMLAEKTKQHYADLYEEARDILKSEAYKEFAERLKEKSFKTIKNYGLTKDVVEVCNIDNLLKEMVGKTK